MIDPEIEFIPPPEAPVFEPSWEEFQDPLGYISKIKPIAERTGICKIKPPPDWQPPFAVDVDSFRFTPRIQRLNELEAKTRIKLQFLDQLCKFWELQGTPLRIPCVEKKYLDLYLLRTIVNEEGGFELVCRERKWSKVANRMGYPLHKGVGSTLRNHYEKILFPYDVFKAGALIDPKDLEEPRESKRKIEQVGPIIIDSDSDVPKKESDTEIKTEVRELRNGDSGKTEDDDSNGGMRRSRRIQKDDQKTVISKELQRLQYFGAGPKAAVVDIDALDDEDDRPLEDGKKRIKTRIKKGVSYVDQYFCSVCCKGNDEHFMLLCDNCDEAFHTYCLIPQIDIIPKGDWRCPRCVAKECSAPKEAYGFAQATKEYTLQTFGEMADQFKLDYFNMPVHMVPCSTVETEFWRLVSCIEEDVIVEYGADIHAVEMGSGFPTETTRDQFPDDDEYIKSGWNLNVLPVLDKSVLKHINADISGMKIPWCYVGMCFSSFCWHIEDHWSYSINYMHWGEPKTWYGVPGSKAPLLEECMRKNAPELFEQSPDLLHQLTTIMNPNILMSYGVPIVRTNQHAGEFVVTFPRAYHAGFNQGYNFAEAVNFCPADWMAMGRGCIEHYRVLHRQCVFSHEELVCKMAANPEQLDLGMAAAVHADMLVMVESEKKARKMLLDRGTTEAEREAFELLPDDERQCNFCNTTCFLSALTCPCSPTKLVCMQHADKLCSCPPSRHCLRYRYTLDELPAMLHRLKLRAESFDNWAYKVKSALEAPQNQRLDLDELKEFVVEAAEKRFPDSPLLQSLEEAVFEAEKCAAVANQLVTSKIRTRCRQSGDSKYQAKLSLEELQAFSEQMSSLPCKIKEADLIHDLLQKVLEFQSEAEDSLAAERPISATLDKLLDTSVGLDVELMETTRLKQALGQAKWLDQVEEMLNDSVDVTLESMRRLIDSGVALVPHPACEKAMAELQAILTSGEQMEERVKQCIQARPRNPLSDFESLVKEAALIQCYLPSIELIEDAIRKATEWTTRVDAIKNGEHYPYLDVLEGILNKGRPIPVRLEQLPQLETQVSAAKAWRERTARTFLKKNSTYTLVEVLSPRTDVGMYVSGKSRRKKKEGEPGYKEGSVFGEGDETKDPATIVAEYKKMEAAELDMIHELRMRNSEKETSDEPDQKYCVCRRGTSGLMLQCELCRDWFHSACVPLPKSAQQKGKSSMAAAVQVAKDLKFMCPLCLRSRRPRLETILSLLVSLQKLPARMPEGEALQCLTECAMAWQDRARQSLATDELSSALAKLSVFSQKMSEAAAREKTEKIISAELLKAANNPELQPKMSGFGSNASALSEDDDSCSGLRGTRSSGRYSGGVGAGGDGGEGDSEDTHSDIELEGQLGSPPPGMEHAYSSYAQPGDGPMRTKHPRKTRHNVRQTDAPVIRLSEQVRLKLEELMMEGDLLEVSLDETQHIWRIIQAANAVPELEAEAEATTGSALSAAKRLPFGGTAGEAALGLDLGGKKKKKRKEGDLMKDDDKIKKKKLKGKDDGEKKRRRKKHDGFANLPEGGGNMLPGDISYRRNEKGVIMLNEEEDICSALKCLRPHGAEVNWVQCDRCEEWFHMVCIGVTENDISENEDYICFQCRNPHRPKPLGSTGHDTGLSMAGAGDRAGGVSGGYMGKPHMTPTKSPTRYPPPQRSPSSHVMSKFARELEMDQQRSQAALSGAGMRRDSRKIVEEEDEGDEEDMAADEEEEYDEDDEEVEESEEMRDWRRRQQSHSNAPPTSHTTAPRQYSMPPTTQRQPPFHRSTSPVLRQSNEGPPSRPQQEMQGGYGGYPQNQRSTHGPMSPERPRLQVYPPYVPKQQHPYQQSQQPPLAAQRSPPPGNTQSHLPRSSVPPFAGVGMGSSYLHEQYPPVSHQQRAPLSHQPPQQQQTHHQQQAPHPFYNNLSSAQPHLPPVRFDAHHIPQRPYPSVPEVASQGGYPAASQSLPMVSTSQVAGAASHQYVPPSQLELNQFSLASRLNLVRQSGTIAGLGVGNFPTGGSGPAFAGAQHSMMRDRIPSPVQDAALTMVTNLAAGGTHLRPPMQQSGSNGAEEFRS